jgi:uncharacterized protein YbjT (DUF2867 family)
LAEEHPLDESFDDFIETTWVEDVAPALDELDELVRSAGIRSLFFENVLGDLKSYFSAAVALASGQIAHTPIEGQVAIAAISPLAAAVAASYKKRRAYVAHDFLFLKRLNDKLSYG